MILKFVKIVGDIHVRKKTPERVFDYNDKDWWDIYDIEEVLLDFYVFRNVKVSVVWSFSYLSFFLVPWLELYYKVV